MRLKIFFSLVLLLGLTEFAHAKPGLCYEIVGSEIMFLKQVTLAYPAQAVCLGEVKGWGGIYKTVTLWRENKVVGAFAAEEIKGKCWNSNCNTYVLRSGHVADVGNVSKEVSGTAFSFNEAKWELRVDGQTHQISRTK